MDLNRKSFFSRIQGWFDARYDGRYLGFILAEIGNRHPALMAHVLGQCLGLPPGRLRKAFYDAEYQFGGRSSDRRADLAIFERADADEPMAFIEIKYHDGLGAATVDRPSQLADYLRWRAADHGRRVLVLSRVTLDLPDVATMTWTRAAQLLRKRLNRHRSDMGQALVDHLEEEGIVMQQIEARALLGFAKRLLFGHHGAGQQAGNLDGPQEFGKLLLNVKLLSDRFNEKFKAAWKTAGSKHNRPDDPLRTKKATIDFDVIKRLKETSRGVLDEQGFVKPGSENGGRLFVFARHSLGSGKGWIRVTYGIWIDIDSGVTHARGRHPACYLYVRVKNKEDTFESEKKISFGMVTTKAHESIDSLARITATHLIAALQQAIDGDAQMTTKQRTAVRLLTKELRKGIAPA